MRLAASIVVAGIILWAVDAELNDGRYTEVVLMAVRHIALAIGFRI